MCLLITVLPYNIGDSVKTNMAGNSNINIFQTLEKFSGKNNDDLSSWLRGFNRCCVIAGKSDDDLVIKRSLCCREIGGREKDSTIFYLLERKTGNCV